MKELSFLNQNRLPVLRALLRFQASILIIGIFAIGAAIWRERQHQFENTLQRAKERIAPVILAREQQWRVWKYLGLEIPLADEIRVVLKQHPIKSIEILSVKEAYKNVAHGTLILPELIRGLDPNLPEEVLDLVVVSKLDTDRLYLSTAASYNFYYVMIFLSLSFILLIIVTAVYIRRRIYRPILALATSIDDAGKKFNANLSGIEATGEIREIIEHIQTIYKQVLAAQQDAALGQFAAQVAHDIASPLTALEMVASDPNKSEDNSLLLQNAILRIKDIASSLIVKRGRVTSAALPGLDIEEITSPVRISDLIERILKEKKIQYHLKKDLKFEFNQIEKYRDIFVSVHIGQMQRVLSNLINNCVESFSGPGKVEILLEADSAEVKIIVKDNGSGIPAAILPTLMERGASHGKANGSGLGLFHARQKVESWQGKLVIQSVLGQGTSVIIKLPRKLSSNP